MEETLWLGVEPVLWIYGGAIAVLLCFSGFFSGSETALTAASKSRMHHLEKEGSSRAKVVNTLLGDRESLIGAILLGNNVVNILASALATSLLIGLFGEAGVAYATLGMTLLVLIFAEVLPKTYAIRHHDAMALTVAPIMRVLVFILAPITKMVFAVVRTTLRLLGADTAGAGADHDEILRGVIDLHGRDADAHEDAVNERQMLGGVLDLADLTVEDVMVHRQTMEMIDDSLPTIEIIDQVLASPYTRLPIYRDEPENIVAILHAKDVLRAVAKTAVEALPELNVLALAKDPWFVPETTTLRAQLAAFRERRAHFALVVDEYGALMGLVTLEDIIEEIVGEISDEFDQEARTFETDDEGAVIADGTTPIRDLNRAFDWELSDEHAATIAGLVIHEAREIPARGAKFTAHGYRFEVLEATPTRVTQVWVQQVPEEGEDGESAAPDDARAT